MTSRRSLGCIWRFSAQRAFKKGFSLIEVVVAVGLCTFALSILAGLLPLGLGVIQNATQQIVETEIFDNLWSQANNISYIDLPTSSMFSSSPAFYFDEDGNQLVSTGATVPAGTVYIVRCSLLTDSSTLPVIDGSNTTGTCMLLAQVQIGYHVDPSGDQVANDSRVATRNFLLVKRDGAITP